jgi:mono/diheme cytochrome c family protein
MKLTKITIIGTLCLLSSSTIFAQAKKVAAKPKTGGVSATVMASGKAVFGKTCITCHMADGLGVPNMNPPLAKTTFVLGDKAKLIKIVTGGLNESIDIGDNTFSGVMPAQDFLKDQEIADVLTYVRNSFGNKATAVTLAEVKKARAAKK